ncbi:hypothetical protein TRIATDRAFT_254536 [Trichoderma atroviride IMI 206040]|uniref:Uncharacterized protein n=1 Tax=Hypocrea atroviridis (strain ATCC 20476 / IMI 206040) TaxID=452589 RepID=G9NGN9_HYPAI|nr:uncharacterized protein TRIATDRAFT_297215 [Trichoderma atroviride IMI 206040]EHK50450.1 hypothetical protein TRIATDRAFT_254536 [Trichoderma atroviride IMI 206040]
MYFRYVPIAARSGLAVEREGAKKTSAGVFQHHAPLHNDISTPICKTLPGISSLHFMLMPLGTTLPTEASAWSQRAYYSLSSHLSNILEPWDHP